MHNVSNSWCHRTKIELMTRQQQWCINFISCDLQSERIKQLKREIHTSENCTSGQYLSKHVRVLKSTKDSTAYIWNFRSTLFTAYRFCTFTVYKRLHCFTCTIFMYWGFEHLSVLWKLSYCFVFADSFCNLLQEKLNLNMNVIHYLVMLTCF